MTCPDCEEPMDREDRTGEEQRVSVKLTDTGVAVSRTCATVFWGAEYFCPKCHASWYWSKREGLLSIGNNSGGGDTVWSYISGGYDENGQVWD